LNSNYVTVNLFAGLKDKLRSNQLKIPLNNSLNFKDFLLQISIKYPNFKDIRIDIINKKKNIYAIFLNGEKLEFDSIDKIQIEPGNEIAILPPISGG
jgi:molybdopterin converting factor small subunit